MGLIKEIKEEWKKASIVQRIILVLAIPFIAIITFIVYILGSIIKFINEGLGRTR